MPDGLSAALADIRDRHARVARRQGGAASWIEETRMLAEEAVPALLAALDAVLAGHPLTAAVRFCSRPCPSHEFGGVLARRECPDCVKVEYRDGCRECRDECGTPVRPGDCRARKAILAGLTGKEAM